ncbi:hypothetical protein C1H76_0372 [Elsinoe australis]|uniref:Uncharacterized protein n=1 Tax=Elsinoe australis TaxID=40998 RepID=A0A4U7BFR7_9PEZI|nr:hypothetical protein C1H76_0372 [Elsinoe australis]
MAAPRLTFLWPFLFKPVQSGVNRTVPRTIRRKAHSSAIRRQDTYPQRYGTANEPLPELRNPPAAGKDKKAAESQNGAKSNGRQKKDKSAKDKSASPTQEKDAATEAKSEPEAIQLGPPDLASAAPAVMSINPSSSTSSSTSSSKPSSDTQPSQAPPKAAQDTKPESKDARPTAQDSTTISPSPLPGPPSTPTPGPLRILSQNPLETVLNLPASDEHQTAQLPSQTYYHENASDPSEHRPPHISTPRYVHHFDTYSLVNRLKEGGWSPDQAITAMKAVRLILADNIDLARDGLVSKSNVENEQYLFRAACSELRTEVGMRRKADTEKSRAERTGLQHEVDILGQRVGMETQSLREELKGMVEGRKMAVREEGREVDSKLQELNYRITVALNSDSRSDVEGVRWLITKRAIAALAICVAMVLTSLRYASSVAQQEEEAKKRERARQRQAQAQGREQGGQRREGGGEGREGSTDMLVNQGDNPSFISLG